MSTELREWITETWEYCQEHWIAAAAVGAVLLLLLISAILVRTAKSEEPENDILQDVPAEPAVPEPAASEQEEEPEEEPESVKLQESAVYPSAAQGVVENLLKSVEAASGAAGQKVEAIELKIEKAQLTIHYAGSSRTESVSEITAEKKETAAEEDFAEKAEPPAAEPEPSGMIKKFGQDNMNRARSGRVYTEEELLDQIRD